MNNKRIHELLEHVKGYLVKLPVPSTADSNLTIEGFFELQANRHILEILQHLLEVDIENDPGGRSFCGDCDGNLILETFKGILIDPNGNYHDCKNGLSSDEYRVIKENKSQKDKEEK